MPAGQTRLVSYLRKDGKINHNMRPVLYKVVDGKRIESKFYNRQE